MAVSIIDVKEIALRGSNLVVFGDSWSQPNIPNSEDEYWVKRVAAAFGMTRFNFAIAGAGFGRASEPITNQLTTANSTMTAYEKEHTSVVIALMGDNDLLNNVTDTDILNGVAAFNQQCATMFPNAKQILIPFEWSYGGLTHAYNNRIETLIHKFYGILTHPCMVVPDARYWTLGVAENYRNQGHLSVTGYQRLAGRIMGIMQGNNYGGSSWGGSITLTAGDVQNTYYTFENGIIHLHFEIGWDNYSPSGYSAIVGYVPDICNPEHDMYFPLTTLGSIIGTLRIDPSDKSLNVNGLTTTAGKSGFVDITYQAVCNAQWSA